MNYSKDFSIIIPVWRGAIKFLPKLLESIPDNNGIEIIIVDNSIEPIKREEIDSSRHLILLNSAPERHAGGSRNDGIVHATGKWILFADADDYFTPNAFDEFYSLFETDADIVYSKPNGIYEDTSEFSDRGELYANLAHGYCVGEVSEMELRLRFTVPWCKMIRHDFIDKYKIKFDEIKAGNDSYFSLLCGYYAAKIKVIDKVTYIVTVNRGSLTQRLDYDVIKARLYSNLHTNQFLREHGLSNYQTSIMYYLYEGRRYGLTTLYEFLQLIIKFRQNPFVGWSNWIKTIFEMRKKNVQNAKYMINNY